MFYLTNLLNWLNVFGANESKEKDSLSGENNNFSSKAESKEKVTILSPQANPQFSSEVQSVLSDFEKLDFEDNKCFDKIAGSYEKEGKKDLFDDVILNKQKYIIDILSRKLAPKDQENFREELGKYILKINKKVSYGKEFQNRLQFFEGRAEEVLSDFRKLNFGFEDNFCRDDKDDVNYNKGWPADPLDKIANYYRWNKNIFLFNYVVLSKQKEIMNILNEKCAFEDKRENFKKRLGRYLLRVNEGMSNGQEFLKTDSAVAFFDGCYVPCAYAKRSLNHYDSLSINITKPGQSLETSCLFTKKIKSEDEVKEVKVYNNSGKIVTIKKNDEQQRNYCFEKDAICDIEISWGAKDESGKDLNCTVVLNINSGQISIRKSTIDAELKKILELAKQNEAVLIKGKNLHEVLAEHLTAQTPCEKEQSHENIVVPDSGAPNSVLDEMTIEEAMPRARGVLA